MPYCSWYHTAVCGVEREKAEFEDEFQNAFKSCGSMRYCVSFSIDFASVNDSGTYDCARIHLDSDAEAAEHKSLCTCSLLSVSIDSRVDSDETGLLPKADESLNVWDVHQVLSLWRR